MLSTIPRLRWWIGGLLFASTVINYIDRQTLNVLAPILKEEFSWTNADFATILISFRLAYTVMQAVGGRLIDLLGTRRGLALSVAFYSIMAMLTSLSQGIGGFRMFRFLLGVGEGPNWPGAAKATAEWFPAKERGWAVALYDSGSAVGGA
ncbi:MAG: MFS transporter, partial [Bryobacterales bacterium]|nr:MFS transporter [Bryobacterales bacterium]